MKYGSVCSGIEAASVAWRSLGWEPSWFSEIEPFPCAVLKYHWPKVPNLGDMTTIAARVTSGEIEAPDVLVGGTPCQAFSVAGLRNGLADKRGQLTLSYVELANAIDAKRRERGEKEAIIVWENVPGVLSSKDNAFGCFLAGLAGEADQLQPAGGKWTNAGFVLGSQRAIAWRILDAQYFGVAQRRRRVFVVASARNDIDPAKILFECDSVRRDTPPSRKARQEVTGTLGSRATSGGGFSTDFECAGGLQPVNGSHWDNTNYPHPTLNQSNNAGGIGMSNQELFSQRGSGIVKAYRMAAFGEYADDETASTCKARDYKDATDIAVTLAFPERMSGTQAASTENLSPAILSKNPTAIAIAGNTIGRAPCNGGNGTGYHREVSYTLTKTDIHGVATGMQVRRLTPIECERLQGFPDNHTMIPWRKKNANDCPDGPRYRAIGNSMAVPVMQWIGMRILMGIFIF